MSTRLDSRHTLPLTRTLPDPCRIRRDKTVEVGRWSHQRCELSRRQSAAVLNSLNSLSIHRVMPYYYYYYYYSDQPVAGSLRVAAVKRVGHHVFKIFRTYNFKFSVGGILESSRIKFTPPEPLTLPTTKRTRHRQDKTVLSCRVPSPDRRRRVATVFLSRRVGRCESGITTTTTTTPV